MKKQQKTDYFENTTKPSLLLGKYSFLVPLLEKTNPILTPQISLQPLILQWFTTSLFKIPQKKRTQLKPISARSRRPVATKPLGDGGSLGEDGGTQVSPNFFREILAFLKQLFMESKPNFKTLRPILTPEKKGTYDNLCPQKHKKSKPNPNPIQTQSKPNPNPIQTQSKPIISRSKPTKI